MGIVQKARNLLEERRRSNAEAYLSRSLPPTAHRFLDFFGAKVGDLVQKDSRAIVPEIESRYGDFWPPPYEPFELQQLYERHWVVNACVSKLVRESTRQGWEWEPEYEVRCSACESEYDYLPLSESCPECGSTSISPPDPAQLVRVHEFCRKPNPDLTLDDILKHAVRDLLVFDDFYDSVSRASLQPGVPGSPPGNPAVELPMELWPEDVRYIQVVSDAKGRLGGKTFCPLEDSTKDATGSITLYEVKRFPPGSPCPKNDGGVLVEAAYVQNVAQETKAAWMKTEIVHTNLYAVGSRHYGTPKLWAIRAQIDAMQLLDVYQRDIFDKGKTPKNIFIAKGFSEESLSRQLKMHEERKKKNPAADMWIAAPLPTQGAIPTGLEKIPGIDSPIVQGAVVHQDYSFKAICYTFGVSPASIGVETSGKLGASQEGTEQRDVTPETINEIQIQTSEAFDRFFKLYFPEIVDWRFRLKSAHEGEDAARWNIKKVQMETAKTAVDAGFDVLIDEDGTPKISGQGKQPAAPAPFGGPEDDAKPTPSMETKAAVSRDSTIDEAAKSYRLVLDGIAKDAYTALKAALTDVLDANTPDNRVTPDLKVALVSRIQRALDPVLAEAEKTAKRAGERLMNLGAAAAELKVAGMGLQKQGELPPREMRNQSVTAMRNTLYFGDKTSYLQIIRDTTDKGIEENWTTDKLSRELQLALDPEKDHYPDWMWDRIARTESASYVIEGERLRYQEFGVPKLKRFVASDAKDDLCAPFAGAVYKTEDAYDVIPSHPNCRCSFSPYFGPEEPIEV